MFYLLTVVMGSNDKCFLFTVTLPLIVTISFTAGRRLQPLRALTDFEGNKNEPKVVLSERFGV